MKNPKRKCKNWIKSFLQYVEETETPKHFWLWAAIFILCAALQRKVWLPFGLDPLFPNLYIMLVAPPGKCRKGAPLGLAKRMLEEVKINVSVDSGSKRGLTKELAEIAKTGIFEYNGKPRTQTAMAVISKELSSLLAVDAKAMIEVLTDLYDCHETWHYKTGHVGEDALFNLCLCCFLGSTPGWISENLPEEALSGGWASRVAIVYGNRKYKRITVPPPPPEALYSDLIYDLGVVSRLVGEFQWGAGAYEVFDTWYQGLDRKYIEVKDERLHSFLERMHIMALKVAMVLHISESNDLILEEYDIGRAIELLEEILSTASAALSGQGRSRTSADVEKILGQIRTLGDVTFIELLRMNYRNTNKAELQEVLETVVAMGVVKPYIDAEGRQAYRWKKERRKKDG